MTGGSYYINSRLHNDECGEKSTQPRVHSTEYNHNMFEPNTIKYLVAIFKKTSCLHFHSVVVQDWRITVFQIKVPDPYLLSHGGQT